MDLPIKNGGSFHSYVSLPEGNHTIKWPLLDCEPHHFMPTKPESKSLRSALRRFRCAGVIEAQLAVLRVAKETRLGTTETQTSGFCDLFKFPKSRGKKHSCHLSSIDGKSIIYFGLPPFVKGTVKEKLVLSPNNAE